MDQKVVTPLPSTISAFLTTLALPPRRLRSTVVQPFSLSPFFGFSTFADRDPLDFVFVLVHGPSLRSSRVSGMHQRRGRRLEPHRLWLPRSGRWRGWTSPHFPLGPVREGRIVWRVESAGVAGVATSSVQVEAQRGGRGWPWVTGQANHGCEIVDLFRIRRVCCHF